MQALELLKGDLDGELFLELQARLAKPKVVPPRKKEDAQLRKRIEKDKAKDQQAKLDQRVYNLRNDLVLAETQAEENRRRVLVLQSEWQALYDQAGEETDEKVEKQLSQGDLESDGMEATDDERIPLGDSGGARNNVRRPRKMAKVRGFRRKFFALPSTSSFDDVLDRVDPSALCQHLLDRLPQEQFEGAMQSLTTNLLQAIAGKAHDRGILDEAAGRAFVERFVHQG